MKGRKVVITGGAGFIGSNLARALAKENHVTIIDNLSTGHLENILNLINSQSVSFVKGSVTNLEILHEMLKDVDYVFHQAAIVSVPHSIKDPISTNNVNINGTLNVLIAARDNKVKKVVFASSCAIYGYQSKLPIRENCLPDLLSPYAASKLIGEYYCQVFTKLYNLPTVSLRYFNVYGPRQDRSSEYAAVIPKFIYKILMNKSPVIYGDGEQTRDFVFIDDVVNANLLAAEVGVTGSYNIAYGRRISINYLIKEIIKIIGKNLDLNHENPRPGDIKHSFADISKAVENLRYKPKVCLSTGLKETVDWIKNKS